MSHFGNGGFSHVGHMTISEMTYNASSGMLIFYLLTKCQRKRQIICIVLHCDRSVCRLLRSMLN